MPSSSAEADQRAIRRTKVFLPAGLTAGPDDAQARAHVLDISPRGARVHARDRAEAGDHVDLIVGDAHTTGSVVWVKYPNFGVRFDEPLSAERLETIVQPSNRREPGGG